MVDRPPDTARTAGALPPWLGRAEPLAPKTTFGVGGAARFWGEWATLAELGECLAFASASRLPIALLGQGSNVVFADGEYAGLVLRARARGLDLADGPAGSAVVRAEAGLPFDALCAAAAEANLAGLECLSGIPGTVGAAPVQNIGAYGQALADTLQGAWLQPLGGGPVRFVPAAELGLGYRTSLLREQPGRFVVTAIQLKLSARPAPVVHEQLQRELALTGPQEVPPATVRAAVLAVRGRKGMLWPGPPGTPGNAGSFFVNPTVSAAEAERLLARFPGLPAFPAPPGVRLAAAWLIEASGLERGHVFFETAGRVGLSPLHALALVNRGGATGRDVLAAAEVVVAKVAHATGLTLQAEACLLGFAPRHGPARCI